VTLTPESARRDVLYNRHGALSDERDRHRVGADAVARDVTGGVGGADEERGDGDGAASDGEGDCQSGCNIPLSSTIS